MLSFIMLNVVMLSGIMSNVVMPSAIASPMEFTLLSSRSMAAMALHRFEFPTSVSFR